MIKGLPYEVIIGSGVLNASSLPHAQHYVLITDETVKDIFWDDLKDTLPKVDLLTIPSGEASKTREIKAQLEDQMLDLNSKRDTMVLALGGGVVGDLAGFIAATFMRGIPYVQIPTTLLAMVDSSIGGKTAVDTPHGKNLIGAIWQPTKVIVDINFLKNLPENSLINGLVEAVKMFMTHDAESLKFARENLQKILAKDPEILTELLKRAVQAKANVVSKDERENGIRAVLNFGHTVGHAMELLSDFQLPHGHAIALGILVEAKLAHLTGHLSQDDFQSVIEIIKSLKFDTSEIEKFTAEQLIDAMQMDKKNAGKEIKYIVLTGLGSVLVEEEKYTHTLDTNILNDALHGW